MTALDVLVLDGHTRAALAVVRSLGRAGFNVGVQALSKDALSPSSRFASEILLSPDPGTSPSDYLSWIEVTLRMRKPRFLLPMTNISLELTLSIEKYIRRHTTFPFVDRETFFQVTNKYTLLKTARELGLTVPQSLSIPEKDRRTVADLRTIEGFCYPAVLKPSFSDKQVGSHFIRARVTYPTCAQDVFTIIDGKTNSDYATLPFLLQEKVLGSGIGVFALCREGEPLAIFCHRRLLEVPPSGGMSALCESIAEGEAPVEDAMKLLRHFRWQGIAMVEFKQTPISNSQNVLIELNPRFWGSLQLAIDAGCDFPKLLIESAHSPSLTVTDFRQVAGTIPAYRKGVRLRWLVGTLDHFLARFREKPFSTIKDVLFRNSLFLFQGISQTRFDTFRWDDPKPFFSELRIYLTQINAAISRRRTQIRQHKPKTILLFIESAGRGGAESMVLFLAKALKQRGYQVSVLTLRTGWLTHALDSSKTPRFQLESSFPFDISLPFRIARLLKRNKIDLLHAHSLDSNFYGGLGAQLAGTLFLGTEHGDIHRPHSKHFVSFKVRMLSFLRCRFTAVSHFTWQGLVESGIKEDLVQVVTNPVTIPQIELLPQLRRDVRLSLGIENEYEKHWLWVHVARFTLVKNQALLLQAFAKTLHGTTWPQTLCLIGDGPERNHLEDLTRALDIQKHVIFLGFQDNTERWLVAADGFLLSSLSEAMPLSLLEAAAHALVIVSTDVGGVREIIQDGQSGFLAPREEITHFSEAMCQVLQNPQESKTMGQRAREVVREKCSPVAVLDEYVRLYNM